MSWPVELLNASNRGLRRQIDALSRSLNEERTSTAVQRDRCDQLHASLRLSREQARTIERILLRESETLQQREETFTRVQQELAGLRQTAHALRTQLPPQQHALHALQRLRSERAGLLTQEHALRATREQELQQHIQSGRARQAYAATHLRPSSALPLADNTRPTQDSPPLLHRPSLTQTRLCRTPIAHETSSQPSHPHNRPTPRLLLHSPRCSVAWRSGSRPCRRLSRSSSDNKSPTARWTHISVTLGRSCRHCVASTGTAYFHCSSSRLTSKPARMRGACTRRPWRL